MDGCHGDVMDGCHGDLMYDYGDVLNGCHSNEMDGCHDDIVKSYQGLVSSDLCAVNIRVQRKKLISLFSPIPSFPQFNFRYTCPLLFLAF